MNKTVTASLAALAVAGMVGGGTFAKWSDFQEMNGNESGAGQLTLDLANGRGGGAAIPFQKVDLAPGEQNESVIYLSTAQLDYDDAGGANSAKLFVHLQDLVGVEDSCTSNSEAAEDTAVNEDCAETTGPNEGDFKDQAQVSITQYIPPAGTTTCPNGGGSYGFLPGETSIWLGSLQDVEDNGRYAVGDVGDNQGACIFINIQMPAGSGFDNKAQGDSADFDLEFVAEQNV